MFATDNSSNPRFHYLSGTTFNIKHKLFVELERSLEKITSSREECSTIPLMYNQDVYIKPVECDQASDLVERIKTTAINMAGCINSLNKLQILPNVNYYKLLMHLFSVNTKSHKIRGMLGEFRSVCMDNSNEQRKMITGIQNEISVFLKICNQIESETEDLFDKMLFDTN